MRGKRKMINKLNEEIREIEHELLRKQFKIEDLKQQIKNIELVELNKILEEKLQGTEKPLHSNTEKRELELSKRLKNNQEYFNLFMDQKELEKEVKTGFIDRDYLKRKFEIIINTTGGK
jgi:septal ring factor EnvC (AmiA/AmiB activator)